MARSRNHYCSGNSTKRNVFSFSTLPQKRRDFRGSAFEHKMCVLVFSTTLSETLPILRRNERNIVSLLKYPCKVPFILLSLYRNLVFSQNIFEKFLENKISWKFIQLRWRVAPLRTDRRANRWTKWRTDRHYKADIRFSRFCKSHSNELRVCPNDFASHQRLLPCSLYW